VDEKPVERRARRPLWETVAIFLAIASLWPAYILNLDGQVWKWISYVMLALMVVVAVRRLRAFGRG
jgi:fatty acid desaturase